MSYDPTTEGLATCDLCGSSEDHEHTPEEYGFEPSCSECLRPVSECMWDGDHPICPDCKFPILRCSWNGGRCLDCHEDALLPSPCGPGCDLERHVLALVSAYSEAQNVLRAWERLQDWDGWTSEHGADSLPRFFWTAMDALALAVVAEAEERDGA